MNLCLDLADCKDQIYTTGEVVWSNSSGRAGLRFSELPANSVSRLRDWLFVNVMAGVANGEADLSALDGDGSSLDGSHPEVAPRPNYTDTLAAVSAIQSQVEALGRDLAAALPLIAERAQTLVRASGAAIALADADPDFMVCRASSGLDAPPVGARLQVGSGFSGECVKTGTLLRCDDAELDPRVDRESCRALGIRSILAAPVRVGEKSIGILEVFSAQPNAFSDTDSGVLQSLAQTVLAAVNRAARAEHLPPLGRPASPEIHPTPGQRPVRFRARRRKENESPQEEAKALQRHQPAPLALDYSGCRRRHDPWRPRLHSGAVDSGQGSGARPQPNPDRAGLIEAPGARKLLGRIHSGSRDRILRATSPDGRQRRPRRRKRLGPALFSRRRKNGIVRNETEAFRWFSRAADHGNVAAQVQAGSHLLGRTWRPKRCATRPTSGPSLARARGDEENKDLAAILASRHDPQPGRIHRTASRLLAPAAHGHLEARSRPLKRCLTRSYFIDRFGKGTDSSRAVLSHRRRGL